jgi:LEA14-like dessication related protein
MQAILVTKNLNRTDQFFYAMMPHSIPYSHPTTGNPMFTYRRALLLLLAFGVFLLSGCAGLRRDSLDVVVAGVEPLQGEGLEFRMLVKLRLQNPNDHAIDFNGVSLQLDVQGKAFATGVSDATGTVPRFGETIVKVPVSISAFRMARQAMDAINNEYRGKLAYELSGKLARPAFRSVRFEAQGELTLPAEFFDSAR